MKILHICLSGAFIDNWGYQENLLPDYLQEAGHQNYVIGPANAFPSFIDKQELAQMQAKGSVYSLPNGVEVHRIRVTKISSSYYFPHKLRKHIESIRPDVILHHNFGPRTLYIADKYAAKHSIPLFVDNHVDEINSNHNPIIRRLYYKGLIKSTCRRLKAAKQFYGVTLARCEFIKNYFGAPESMVSFLPIGADINLAATLLPKDDIRHKYGFDNRSFVVCSGGKMGFKKGTDCLFKAVERLHTSGHNIKLLLFGKFEDDCDKIVKNKDFVHIEGWCDRMKTLELLKLSDIACWPAYHTTLCEDSIAVATPLLLIKLATTRHLINGNGYWLQKGTEDEIHDTLLSMINASEQEKRNVADACTKQRERLSYTSIARQFINDVESYS